GILPLTVEYFIGNNTKEGNGVERTEVKQWSARSTTSNSAGLIREDWGTGSPPNSNVNQDNFIVRWTGYVYASSTGDYKFYENSDDGVRLWVNNRRLIEEW
ncbi:MAG: PA14 domain-containing protein, partial [Aphanizomenon sp.]